MEPTPEDKATAEELWTHLFDDIYSGKVTESLNKDVKDFLDPNDPDLRRSRIETFHQAKSANSNYRAGQRPPSFKQIVDRLDIAFEGTEYRATLCSDNQYSVGPRFIDLTHTVKSPPGKL